MHFIPVFQKPNESIKIKVISINLFIKNAVTGSLICELNSRTRPNLSDSVKKKKFIVHSQIGHSYMNSQEHAEAS